MLPGRLPTGIDKILGVVTSKLNARQAKAISGVIMSLRLLQSIWYKASMKIFS